MTRRAGGGRGGRRGPRASGAQEGERLRPRSSLRMSARDPPAAPRPRPRRVIVTAYLFRRVLAVIPVMFVVVTIVFLLIHLIPGDPVAVILGPDATPAQMEATRTQLGLDRPAARATPRVLRPPAARRSRPLVLPRPAGDAGAVGTRGAHRAPHALGAARGRAHRRAGRPRSPARIPARCWTAC